MKKSTLSLLNDDKDISALLERRQMSEIAEKLEKAAEMAPFLAALTSGFKGEKGDSPVFGKDFLTEEEMDAIKEELRPLKFKDYFTDEEVEWVMNQVYAALLPRLEEIKEEIRPKKGKDFRDGMDAKPVDRDSLMAEILRKIPAPEVFNREEFRREIATELSKDTITVEDVVKEIKEKKLLELRDIKGARLDSPSKASGGFNMNDQRWHGAGSTTSGGANVTTQYLLTAVQVGDNVTIDLTQLAQFTTFQAILVLYRNNIPQTLGLNFTVAGNIVTIISADASEVFNITYSF